MEAHSKYVKNSKIELGKRFIHSLNSRNLHFAGISGSVSYEPAINDDIDIFIISSEMRLWESIFDVLVKRRLSHIDDICLSLAMDERYASDYFARLDDRLIAQDSVMVIPVIGSDYYNGLINSSSLIKEMYPNADRNGNVSPTAGSKPHRIRNFFFFILVSPFVIINALINDHKERENGGGFSMHIRLDSFYFDSLKYRKMRENFGVNNEQIKLLHSDP